MTLLRIYKSNSKTTPMKSFKKILSLGAGAVLLLSSCSTSYNAMKGESDDLYFMASDAQVAREFAVRNNTPQNFQALSSVNEQEFQQENFSARNVNPEYIAKYQVQNNTAESGTVYFDDEAAAQGNNPNINVYNNFYGSGFNNGGWNSPRFNFNMGLGLGFGSPFFGMPMWGGMPMMGMPMWGSPFGFYDPFMFDPFWGSPWNWRMRPGFGMGFGWNTMMGWNMGFGMGFGSMWGSPWGMPVWGRPWGFGNTIIINNPGWSNEPARQIVRGARYGRDGGFSSTGYNRASNMPAAATTRAARRDAVASGRSVVPSSNRVESGRDFARSQNDYYAGERSRVASSAANPTVRNTGSAAATRPSRTSGANAMAPGVSRGDAYSTGRSEYAAQPRTAAPSYNRGAVQPGTRGTSASPSYNRGNTNYNNSSAPSRSVGAPSRVGGSGMSTPSRMNSSPSMSAPSRSSGGSFGGGSVGGYSGGGRSSGGGGGYSSGGGGVSRGGRGN